MKSKILVLFLSVSIGLPLYASSPCHHSFAVAAAYAHREYMGDLADCDDMLVYSGPCRDEATAKYNQNLHNQVQNFSQCCCVHQLACCG